MIFVTGDTHADFRRRFNTENFPEQKNMTKDDYVIICGDFGGVWEQKESKEEKYWLDWFNSRNYTLLVLEGNHDNHERLQQYPVKEFNGGKVHQIRESVYHLMRGQVYMLQGKKFFTFGGASSHDISDGILEPNDPCFLEKKKQLDRKRALYRINHVSWWKEELASEEEMQEGLRNLQKHGNKVDFIVTHCCSNSTQQLLGGSAYQMDRQTEYLEQIKNQTSFQKWFFGHYHDNVNVNEKEILIYEQIIRIL